MDLVVILARLIHIVGGVFWVGAMMFVVFFLVPAMNEAGPDAAKVMTGVAKRGFMQIMPVVAILVILSGMYLYWRASGGDLYHYFQHRSGHTYALGGVLAIIAFLLGVTITRPAMIKATALSQSAMTASEAERGAMLAEAQRLRLRGSSVGKWVVGMLLIATITMAIGRYV